MKPFENKKELDRHCFRFGTSTYAWSITSAVRRMCGSDDPDRIGTQKEAALKRMERDENDVQKIITFFNSGLMKDQLVLFCPPMKLNGCWQVNSFIEQRLNTNTVSFWDAIPNLKNNTFSSMKKKTTVKSTNEKLVTWTEDRVWSRRLLVVFLRVPSVCARAYGTVESSQQRISLTVKIFSKTTSFRLPELQSSTDKMNKKKAMRKFE